MRPVLGVLYIEADGMEMDRLEVWVRLIARVELKLSDRSRRFLFYHRVSVCLAIPHLFVLACFVTKSLGRNIARQGDSFGVLCGVVRARRLEASPSNSGRNGFPIEQASHGCPLGRS